MVVCDLVGGLGDVLRELLIFVVSTYYLKKENKNTFNPSWRGEQVQPIRGNTYKCIGCK
jgi:hypothetical protein